MDVTHSNLNSRLSGGLQGGKCRKINNMSVWEFNLYTSAEEKQNQHTNTQTSFHSAHRSCSFVTFWGNGKKTIAWKPTPGHLTPYCKHQTSQLFFSNIKQNISDSNELELIRPQKYTCNFSHRLTFKGILVYLYDTNPTNALLKVHIMANQST